MLDTAEYGGATVVAIFRRFLHRAWASVFSVIAIFRRFLRWVSSSFLSFSCCSALILVDSSSIVVINSDSVNSSVLCCNKKIS